ncbi:unnamed protein product [Lathyrus sativus]|nr:unnamed protein product [Lathyrus sativus]CAK8080066.1 unnamed protein product [Lathyrus sativus]CAK8089634.1 unnamed protein product [Lathyrus sativus]
MVFERNTNVLLTSFVVVKDVVLKLKPLQTKDELLVFAAVGIKLKVIIINLRRKQGAIDLKFLSVVVVLILENENMEGLERLLWSCFDV